MTVRAVCSLTLKSPARKHGFLPLLPHGPVLRVGQATMPGLARVSSIGRDGREEPRCERTISYYDIVEGFHVFIALTMELMVNYTDTL